jgi:tetratricopeptide (TPR) repeat protein
MAQLAVPAVITAATQLMRAAQWAAATDLLRAAATNDPADRRALALALAEVTVDQDFAQQTDQAGPELAAAARALETLPDATTSWDLAMLHLRKDYSSELFRSDRTTSGAEARDQTTAVALTGRALHLRDNAPDDARRGLASFYAGVIADNLAADQEAAFTHFTTALELGERSSDDLLVSLALRHLGDHAHTAGDLELAREQWERSTELRQKVGHLLGALAQQALLAVLLRDVGNFTGARALATEVNRWSHQVGLKFITNQTAELMR